MKKITSVLFVLLLSSTVIAGGYDFFDDGYKEVGDTTMTNFQLRAGVGVKKKFRKVSVGINEELRFVIAPMSYATVFDKSFTTVSVAYSPVEHLKLDAGYMLKIIGASSASKWNQHWSDVNEFMRHRVFFSVSVPFKIGQFKLSFRERALLDIRTDSVNPLEKNAKDWTLRHRLSFEYAFRSLPLKPYTWLELANTLNVPDYQKKYKYNNPTKYKGHQYLERVRWEAGLNWRLNQHNSLNFFYRMERNYSRDVNVTKGAGKAELMEKTLIQNAVGIVYEFNL